MVSKYKRKTTRQSWNEDSMMRAIEAVKKKEMGWLKASKIFGVPQATLRRRAEGGKNKLFRGCEKGLGRFQTTFSSETEKELLSHLQLLESRGFGLTPTDVRTLAYQLAEKNGLQHRFNNETQKAGWDWLAGFRKRNPGISLRKPEGTSFARASGFNKEAVMTFFNTFEKVLAEINIPPNRIYNMDESALTTVHDPPKVFAKTGKKQVGTITSGERGSHVTVVCAVSATGHYIPPVFIFARKNLKHELLDGAPVGSIGLVQEKGWMTGELFEKVLKHFVNHAKPSVDDKILLIIDGHTSHKQLPVLEYAKENGIVLVCLPPHCTHHMQPLDVSFYGPLKTYYNQEVHKWLRNHPGRVVTQYQICSLFTGAYGKAATIHNAQSSFQNTGLYPFNRDIFPQHLFVPSETAQDDVVTSVQASANNDFQHSTKSSSDNGHLRPGQDSENIVSGASGESSSGPSTSGNTAKVSIESVSPVPVASSTAKRRRGRENQTVLTSSPYMKEKKEKHAEKIRKSQRSAKKRLAFTPDAASEEILFGDGVADDDDDAACIYCNDLFTRSKAFEVWLQCTQCKRWAHAECAGLNKRAKMFVCEICKP